MAARKIQRAKEENRSAKKAAVGEGLGAGGKGGKHGKSAAGLKVKGMKGKKGKK